MSHSLGSEGAYKCGYQDIEGATALIFELLCGNFESVKWHGLCWDIAMQIM